MLAFTTSERIDLAVAISGGLVALATFLLALSTRSMAKQTKNEAEATKEEAAISARALRTAVRPWLTRDVGNPVPSVSVRSRDSFDVNLSLRNVGSGLAVVPPGGASIEGGGIERVGFANHPAIPKGDAFALTFRVAGLDVVADDFFNRPATTGEFRIRITYTDANGEQPVEMLIHVVCPREDNKDFWMLGRAEYADARSGHVFQTVSFDASLAAM